MKPGRFFAKLLWVGLILTLAMLAAGCGTRPPVLPGPTFEAVGVAGYYGSGFHGRRTASGEIFDMHALTAAHPRLSFGSKVEVTHLKNGRQVVVRINDRGPYVRGRIIDLSYAAAKKINLLSSGTAKVKVRLMP